MRGKILRKLTIGITRGFVADEIAERARGEIGQINLRVLEEVIGMTKRHRLYKEKID